MRLTSTIMRAGLLALGAVALATPSLAQTGAPAGSGENRSPTAAGIYPGQLAPGAVMPPYLASPPYIGPGGFITLPSETTGSSIRPVGPSGVDMPSEAPTPSRKSLIDDE
jgi:hypothetical protein